MNRRQCLAGGLSAAAVMMLAMPHARAVAAAGHRLTGPVGHANLSVYFVHRAAAAGAPVPATLQEAMARGTVTVHETGSVNDLAIENLGTEAVFVHAGDIVKGGKQDRVLMVSMLLPPNSGKLPIASFCVEQGRWSARGREDATKFASADQVLPSRRSKLAMRAPVRQEAAEPPPPPRIDGPMVYDPRDRQGRTVREPRGGRGGGSETGMRQQEMWRSVAETQLRLSAAVGRPVAAAQSQSSLQLTLENDRLRDEQAAYRAALSPAGEAADDIAGFVFAINGQLNSGEVYAAPKLFRKMWPKLISAGITEAIAERGAAAPRLAPSTLEQVQAFLAAAESGEASMRDLPAGNRLETRESAASFSFTAAHAGDWFHRSYLAK